MPSPQSEAIRVLYRAMGDELAANPDMTLEQTRDLFEHWGDLTADPGGVDYLEFEAAGVRCMWAIPHGCADDRVIVCAHGGGYICNSIYSHRKMYGHLAKAAGVRALLVDYRRAPEHPHPAPMEDAVAVYGWLLDNGYRPEHIATAGDSSGGGLSIAMILAARDHGLPLPAAAMPLSPRVDLEAIGESMVTNVDTDLLASPQVVEDMTNTYLGGASRTDPWASPLYADLTGLPPMYLQTGGDEMLRDDAVMFAERARAAGVEVRLEVWDGMQHVHQMMAGRAPEADESIRRMAEWVRPKLGL